MKMFIVCLSVPIAENPNFILSQFQNVQSQFVGQSLDTCSHSPPRSPHMEQSPVHSCRIPPNVGHDTSLSILAGYWSQPHIIWLSKTKKTLHMNK